MMNFFSSGGGYAGFGPYQTGTGVEYIAFKIIGLINGVAVPLLFAISFILFLYGVAKAYIFSSGDESEVKKGHHAILWGIIGFVVMVSVWGLVNIVSNTLGLQGPGSMMQMYPNSILQPGIMTQ